MWSTARSLLFNKGVDHTEATYITDFVVGGVAFLLAMVMWTPVLKARKKNIFAVVFFSMFYTTIALSFIAVGILHLQYANEKDDLYITLHPLTLLLLSAAGTALWPTVAECLWQQKASAFSGVHPRWVFWIIGFVLFIVHMFLVMFLEVFSIGIAVAFLALPATLLAIAWSIRAARDPKRQPSKKFSGPGGRSPTIFLPCIVGVLGVCSAIAGSVLNAVVDDACAADPPTDSCPLPESFNHNALLNVLLIVAISAMAWPALMMTYSPEWLADYFWLEELPFTELSSNDSSGSVKGKSNSSRTGTVSSLGDIESSGSWGGTTSFRSRRGTLALAARQSFEEQGGWPKLHQLADVASLIGKRPSLEDAYLIVPNLNDVRELKLRDGLPRAVYAIYDGHAGKNVALYAKGLLHLNVSRDPAFAAGRVEEALARGFAATDAHLVKECNANGYSDGATAVVAYVIGRTLYVANVGDSEAVIARDPTAPLDRPAPAASEAAAKVQLEPIVASKKHSLSDPEEKERVTKMGGLISKNRLFGQLAVARSLGDAGYKIPKAAANYVSAEPHILSMELNPSHKFLLISCDGLYETVNYQQAVDFISDKLAELRSPGEICKLLANKAIALGSGDNVTCVLVVFDWEFAGK